MEDLFKRIWENLIHRTEGPMHFRFVLQPAVSLFFAIRAAMRDTKNNTVPYFWRFMISKGQRAEIAKEAWKDVGKVFIFGMVLDIIYQIIVVNIEKTKERFYPLESIIVAFALAILPYIIFRGAVNRVLRKIKAKEN